MHIDFNKAASACIRHFGLILMLLFNAGSVLQGEEINIVVPQGGVAIFGAPSPNESISAVTVESIKILKQTFNECGRFMPVEDNQLQGALNKIRNSTAPEEAFAEAANFLHADVYVIISVFQSGNIYFGNLKIISLNPEYQRVQKIINMKSKILGNIPLKMARAITGLHSRLPVSAGIIKELGKDLFVIDVGQWHGLKKGTYNSVKHGKIEIIESGREESVARMHVKESEKEDNILIEHYPDVKRIISDFDDRISNNAIQKYNMEASQIQGDDSRKRLIEGICIINPLGNVCMPGYGAFLSTHYLGFKNGQADIPGVVFSGALITTHLLLPEILTSFKINFFPWIKDSDKSEKMQNLQLLLWCGLPIVMTASYLDQLAFQFERSEVLPPFFQDRDTMAAVLSFFIPGGGFFYKGYRMAGWSLYISEMILAGYGVYHIDYNRGKYALSILGIIKLAEIVEAYLIRPSYRHFQLEIGRREGETGFVFSAYKSLNKDLVYTGGIFYTF